MTTRIRTSGACHRTPRRSRIDSTDPFVLTLWTDDRELARRADAAGIQRIGVDLERLGKQERQGGRGTWISSHTIDDLAAIGPVLTRARLFARVNPLNPGSREEVRAVLAAGAKVLMLPWVRTAREAATFATLVDGRAHVVLLVECREAVERLPELAAVEGVAEVHLGLNDLALSLGLRNRWLVLAGDLVTEAAAHVLGAGLRFGWGGLGRVDDDTLPIPSDLIYAEYARTRATAALISRSFHAGSQRDLAREVTRMRERLALWHGRDGVALADAHAELVRLAGGIDNW